MSRASTVRKDSLNKKSLNNTVAELLHTSKRKVEVECAVCKNEWYHVFCL